jgi:DNA-binding transcriptional ArsR family regulator
MPGGHLDLGPAAAACPFAKAVLWPIRLEILCLLSIHPWSVGQLAEQLDLDRRHVSGNLAVLLRAGLVHCDADGRRRTYRLTGRAAVTRAGGTLIWRLRSPEWLEIQLASPVRVGGSLAIGDPLSLEDDGGAARTG